ncbi:MAG: chemotaxis protein CheW [Myxococcota bacterium]|nr:chemotaxis protein CheW [Myxococcota bacterium]
MSDDTEGAYYSADGIGVGGSKGLPPLIGVQDVTDISGFFVTEAEQEQSLASYLADPAFAVAPTMGGDIVELLSFWVADEEYAVDILEIREIIKLPEITDVPRAPRPLLGVISLRGVVVPILDLRLVLNLDSSEPTRSSRVLVLRAQDEPVGILVDRVTSVVRLDKRAIEPKPATMRLDVAEVIDGVGRVEDRVLIVLDGSAVVEVLERE